MIPSWSTAHIINRSRGLLRRSSQAPLHPMGLSRRLSPQVIDFYLRFNGIPNSCSSGMSLIVGYLKPCYERLVGLAHEPS